MYNSLFSYLGNFPESLPEIWKTPNGVRLNLYAMSDEELLNLGWKKVNSLEENEIYDYFIHKAFWNSETFSWDIIDLTIDEREKKIRYQQFWDFLLETNVYKNLKELSKNSLSVNVILTEFVALLSDAKLGFANILKIQENFLEIMQLINSNLDYIAEVEECFMFCGLYSVYDLGKEYTVDEIKTIKRRIEIKIRDGLISPH